MPWFNYRQNNSGGFFCEPAVNVHIEADSAKEANRIAEENGLYFNGVDSHQDCECCGDRWHEQWDDEDGDKVPSSYGTPLTEEEKEGKTLYWGHKEHLLIPKK